MFRFYFITDETSAKITTETDLIVSLLRFVKMSDKKHQQKTIEEIRNILLQLGPAGFT